MERTIRDKFGNELNIGDAVCFVSNPGADWRQTKDIIRLTIDKFVFGRTKNKFGEYTDWLIFNDYDLKVSPKRVVKCY